MYDFRVNSKSDLIDAVQTFGIVPYFSTSIPGFSLEEHCHPSVLFSEDDENTWFWKGPVIRETRCAYGKFFEKKAAYVRSDLFLDLTGGTGMILMPAMMTASQSFPTKNCLN